MSSSAAFEWSLGPAHALGDPPPTTLHGRDGERMAGIQEG